VSVPENVEIEVSMEVDNWGFGRVEGAPVNAQ